MACRSISALISSGVRSAGMTPVWPTSSVLSSELIPPMWSNSRNISTVNGFMLRRARLASLPPTSESRLCRIAFGAPVLPLVSSTRPDAPSAARRS